MSRRGVPEYLSDKISYPFPLESGELAHLYLPKTITAADVERIAEALRALVVPLPEDDA